MYGSRAAGAQMDERDHLRSTVLIISKSLSRLKVGLFEALKDVRRWLMTHSRIEQTTASLTRWATMKKYISCNLIWVIKHLYDKATSPVLFYGSIEDWFWTTLYSSPPFSKIKDHDRCLRFRRSWRHCHHWTLWRQNNHQSPLCWWHWQLSRRGRTGKLSWVSWQSLHSTEISAEKIKLMTNNTDGINSEIKVNEMDRSFR